MEYQLNDIHLIYDMEVGEEATPALQDVNLKLDGKGLVGITGPSGSGKSSLLYVMAGLRLPTSGKVLYGDTCLNDLPMSELASLRRENFGFIFQQHFLINYMTVMENALVPLNVNSKCMKEKAMALFERMGIAKYADKYPYQMSGGQRQRAAIARALMNDPKVIFGDEPTAALDRKSAGEVMQLLSEYTDNTMVVIVTHDESLLKSADKLISVSDGRIVNASEPGGRL